MPLTKFMTKKSTKKIVDDDSKQQLICNDFHEWTMAQMLEYKPVLVLMTILGQTIKIMKTTMPPAEFEALMETMYTSKDKVEPFTKPTIN